MPDEKKLVEDAIALGIASFENTTGALPEGYKLMLEHVPGVFAGYGLLRSAVMKEGALDLKTKELIFALIDTAIGATEGAKVHAANAIRMGLSVEALAEGLAQCIMAAGVTTWNITGKATLQHAIQVRDELAKKKGGA
jgi:alkylhydroperoxidase/carboxymuconolactone decarboxylase family protein YurZ